MSLSKGVGGGASLSPFGGLGVFLSAGVFLEPVEGGGRRFAVPIRGLQLISYHCKVAIIIMRYNCINQRSGFMKKICTFVILILCFTFFGFAEDITYIPIQNTNNITSIVISDIKDFRRLITDYNVKHVLYTNSVFLIQAVALPFPFSILSNGYKSIVDFQNGNEKNFRDGASYYYANQNKLTNQEEVDYYKQETFFSPEDYRQAQKEGFVKNNAAIKLTKISGIIKKSDLEKNIRFANVIIYLMYYQQSDTVRSFLDNKEIYRLLLPFGNSRNTTNIIAEFKSGYYYVNLDLNTIFPNSNKSIYSYNDAIFFYACKFAQYTHFDDYISTNFPAVQNLYTIKNTETIATKELKYSSYIECLSKINELLGRR